MRSYTDLAQQQHITNDEAESRAIAAHEIRRWLDRQGKHLVRSVAVAQEAGAWSRVAFLAWRLVGVGLVGQLADAERERDLERVRRLEQLVRLRARKRGEEAAA